MADYDLQEAMHLIEPKNIFTTEIKHKVLDFFKPFSILKQNYFKCSEDEIDKYMHLSALIGEKMFGAYNSNLHSEKPPYWYVAIEVVKYIKPKEKLKDSQDPLTPVILDYMDKETMFYKKNLELFIRDYNVVVE